MKPSIQMFGAAFGVAGLLACAAVTSQAAEIEIKGKVRVDLYSINPLSEDSKDGGLGTVDLNTLRNFPAYPDSPTETLFVSAAEFPINNDDITTGPTEDVYNNYGWTVSGLLNPPTTGDWVFYISADDNAALYISTDEDPANLKEVAREPNWAARRYYFQTDGSRYGGDIPSQLDTAAREALPGYGQDKGGSGRGCVITSAGYLKCANNTDPIRMEKGKKYAFRAIIKEAGGGDIFSLWATTEKNPLATLAATYPEYPGGTPSATTGPLPLSGDWISVKSVDKESWKKEPVDITVEEGRPIKLSASINPTASSGKVTWRWTKNGSEVAGAVSGNYDSGVGETPDFPAAGVYNYVAEASFEGGGKLTSRVAKVTVVKDVNPPKVVTSSTFETFTHIRLDFDEDLADSAFQAGSYTIAGLTVTGASQRPPDSGNKRTVILSTSKQAEAKEYTVQLNAGVKDIAGNSANGSVKVTSWSKQKGKVGYAVYIGAASNDDTTAKVQAGEAPYRNEALASMRSPAGILNDAGADFSYGGRLQTIFTAPSSGDYVFYVAGDDPTLLFLSTDDNPANKKLIATDPTWNGDGEWVAPQDGNNIQRNRPGCGAVDGSVAPGDCENRSDQFANTEWPTINAAGKARIALTQGRKYYVEVLWREGGGGDNGAATFTLAGQPAPANGPSALTGDLIEWYGPAAVVANSITGWKRQGGNLVLEFTGVIESAASLGGPWSNVTGTSPLNVSPSAAAAYFRAKP